MVHKTKNGRDDIQYVFLDDEGEEFSVWRTVYSLKAYLFWENEWDMGNKGSLKKLVRLADLHRDAYPLYGETLEKASCS